MLAVKKFLSWQASEMTTLCHLHVASNDRTPVSTLHTGDHEAYAAYLPAVCMVLLRPYAHPVQVPTDDDGKEFWEKLPVEKQDRVPLPAPTAEMIEDMHWQLVPELSEESFRLMLLRHPNGRLPGAGCACKACSVHQREF